MSNHKQFMKALKELLETEIDGRNVNSVQIKYGGSQFIYLSEEKPPTKIHHALGPTYETWHQKTKNGWYIWSY